MVRRRTVHCSVPYSARVLRHLDDCDWACGSRRFSQDATDRAIRMPAANATDVRRVRVFTSTLIALSALAWIPEWVSPESMTLNISGADSAASLYTPE
jgi:hypothetical protein